MHAISTQGLTKTYRSFLRRSGQTALAGVELAIPLGSAFGLIGPNGAGKTTFIKVLLGIVRPDAGDVRVLGGLPDDPAIRARIGYLPERLHLPGAWKPTEFLKSVARLKGFSITEPACVQILERVGIAAAKGRAIGGYSKGMKQRLGLGAALLGAPELLVLDEPTDGIDPMGRVEIRRILAEELSRGATLFLNSHLLSETEKICDRIAILGGGKVLRQGTLTELRQVGVCWRARFEPGAPPEALAQAGFSPSGDRHRIVVSDAQGLNQALDRARQAGALLVELTREEKALEDVLAEAMEAA
jgi:ABC-2 type transport system ATP-binding protein